MENSNGVINNKHNFGVILLFNPFKGAVILMQIIGGIIIAYGAIDIVSSVSLKMMLKTIEQI